MILAETWKSVTGFKGLYEVSDLGRVRSFKKGCGQGRILKPALPKKVSQYKKVKLYKKGYPRKQCRVHLLVAEAFLPPRPTPQHQTRHLNGDRSVNRADNLAWGTIFDNAKDRRRHGRDLIGERHGCAKLSNCDARSIREDRCPTKDLAEAYGVHQTTVQRIRSGRTWSAALQEATDEAAGRTALQDAEQ